MDIQDLRQVFPGALRQTYFDTASQGLPSAPALEALRRELQQLEGGGLPLDRPPAKGGRGSRSTFRSKDRRWSLLESARVNAAAVMGVPAESVIFSGDPESRWRPVAKALKGLALETGRDRVLVLSSGPERSVFEDAGLEVDPGPESPEAADLASLLGPKTAAIFVECVSGSSGRRADAGALQAVAARSGVYMLLDASHAVGAAPLDLSKAAAVAASSHHWLGGTPSLGMTAISKPLADALAWRGRPADLIEDVRLPFFAVAALEKASELLLETGLDAIEAHVAALVEQALDAVSAKGFDAVTPPSAAERLAIASFRHPQPADAVLALAAAGIQASAVADCVRLSFHIYNTEAEIDLLADKL